MAEMREIRSLSFKDAPEMYVSDPDALRSLIGDNRSCASMRGGGPNPSEREESAVVALVTGPPSTPYAHAFFTFYLAFPPQYPNECPRVRFLTTDEGRVRMNPNLYANGKVCLSILGTWRGESPDSWRSSYGIVYILRCLQSLVLTAAPYHNEPGFERNHESSPLSDEAKWYNDKITHESMRVGVIQVLEALYNIVPPSLASPPPITFHLVSPNSRATEAASNGQTDSYGASPLFPPVPSSMYGAGDASPGLSEMYGNNDNDSPLTVDALSTPLQQVATGENGIDVFGSAVMTPTATATEDPPGAAAAPGPQETMLTNSSDATLNYFAPVIKRHADLWMEFYESELTAAHRTRLDGSAFPIARFEATPQNRCSGVYHFTLLSERLQAIQAAMEEETSMWKREGRRITAQGAHQSCLVQIMKSELELCTCGHTTLSCGDSSVQKTAAGLLPSFVAASLVDSDNLFHWQFVIMNPSEAAFRLSVPCDEIAADAASQWAVYEQSMYTVDVVFSPLSLEHPPRIRFLQRIYHPNISPRRGVPFCFASENSDSVGKGDCERRYLPTTVARQLARLLSLRPLCSETAAVNMEAWRQCFSSDETERKMFLRTARQLAERTME